MRMHYRGSEGGTLCGFTDGGVGTAGRVTCPNCLALRPASKSPARPAPPLTAPLAELAEWLAENLPTMQPVVAAWEARGIRQLEAFANGADE